MTELETLIKMINSLPTMALWVLIGFWAYKVIIIGSIYGVIKFTVNVLYQAWQRRIEVKLAEVRASERVDITPTLDGMTITGQLSHLKGQLHRIIMLDGMLSRERRDYVGLSGMMNSHIQYIHSSGVEILRQALDLWEQQHAREVAAKEQAKKDMEARVATASSQADLKR